MKRLSLWLVAAVAIVGLGAGASYWTYVTQEQRLLAETAADLDQARDAFTRALNRVFEPALTLGQTVGDSGIAAAPPAEQADLFFAMTTGPVRRYQQVSGAFLGFPDGRFLHIQDLQVAGNAAGRGPVGDLRRRVIDDPQTDRVGRWEIFNPFGGRWLRLAVEAGEYDPRARPWYGAALRARGPVWTDAYIFASSRQLGVTFARPIYGPGGHLWAVLGIDLSLSALSGVLAETAGVLEGLDDLFFATDLTDRVLAHPGLIADGRALGLDVASALERYQASGSLERVLVEALARPDVVETVALGERRYLATKTQLDPERAMPLQVFVARDKAVALASATATVQRNVALVFLAIVVFGVVAVYAVKLRVEVTARQKAEAEARDAREVAEAATQAKSVFLATMSHEIRTPMNGITSMAELLSLSRLDAEQRRMARVIEDSAAALLTIINDILDFSKIEAGKLEIESVSFSLMEVVNGSAELLAAKAEAKEIDLFVDIDPGLIDRRVGDPTRIRQILINLGGNAVKFTETGSVDIAVKALDDRPDWLRFDVRDTGIGLSEAQRGKLFQAFVQADSSTSRKFGGTGLGLSICRTLADLMGGRIGADSVAGEGSTFWFELPLRPDGAAVPRPDADLSAARVALVGLSGRAREIAMRYLAAGGIAEPRVLDGLDGAARDTADLWLIDIAAPGLTPETLDEIGGTAALAARRADLADLDPALKGRAKALVTYPLSRATLWRAAAIALGLEEPDAADADTREDLAFAPPPLDEARAARAAILVAEDNATNQVVIRQLLGRMGFACEIAENGRVALGMLDRDAHALLLSDFNMPEMDGFELARILRAEERDKGLERLPILALTADAIAGTEDACVEAGMDGYLTKPIDSRKLGAALADFAPQALPLRRAAPEDEAPAADEPGPNGAAPDWDPDIFDVDTLAASFGGLDDEAKALIRSASDAWTGKVADIETALADGDAKRARDVAHALKGASLSVGARRLGRLAADIQDALDDDDPDTAAIMAEVLAPTLDEFRETLPKIMSHRA